MSPSQFNFVGRSNNLANLFREQTNNKSNPTRKKSPATFKFCHRISRHYHLAGWIYNIYHCINFSFSLLAQLMEQLRSLVLFPVQIIENWIESSKVSTWEYIGSDHLSLNRIKGREIPRKSAKCKFEMFF